MQFRQVIVLEDGSQFDSIAEAKAYLRKPAIKKAMLDLTEGREDLATWLVENQETVEMAFEVGTIRRVSKSEANKLAAALDHIAVIMANDKKAAFVVENIGAIKDSFRWPTVKRMDQAEKAAVTKRTLAAATENEELAEWLVANKEAVLEAYQAGIVKREMPQKTLDALAEYKKRKAAELAAASAAAGDAQGEDAEGEDAEDDEPVRESEPEPEQEPVKAAPAKKAVAKKLK